MKTLLNTAVPSTPEEQATERERDSASWVKAIHDRMSRQQKEAMRAHLKRKKGAPRKWTDADLFVLLEKYQMMFRAGIPRDDIVARLCVEYQLSKGALDNRLTEARRVHNK